MCEEFETHQDRSGELDVLMGQSIVLSEIKAEVLLQNENPSYHYVLWQQFVHFMTKDTGDFRQFHTVASREYTLPRDD